MSEETDVQTDGTEAQPQVEETSEATTEPQQGEADKAPTADDAGDTDEGKQKRVPWFQTRINEVTAQKYEAQRERDYYKGKFEALSENRTPQAQQQAVPKLADFDYDEAAYHQALEQHLSQKLEGSIDERLTQRDQTRSKEARTRDALSKLDASERPDMLAAVSHLPLNESVEDFLLTEPNAADVLYALGTDVEASQRFLAMTPYQQAMELGRRAATPAPISNKPIPPAPPATVGGAGSVVNKDPGEMSMSEYVQWRSKNG